MITHVETVVQDVMVVPVHVVRGVEEIVMDVLDLVMMHVKVIVEKNVKVIVETVLKIVHHLLLVRPQAEN